MAGPKSGSGTGRDLVGAKVFAIIAPSIIVLVIGFEENERGPEGFFSKRVEGEIGKGGFNVVSPQCVINWQVILR